MERDDGILAEIAEILGEIPAPHDPEHPAMEEETPACPPDDTGTRLAATSQEPGCQDRTPATVGVRHGQLRQPSDRRTQAKREGLMQEPPKPPRRPAPPPSPNRGPKPLRAVGPQPPPPISVEVEPGLTVEVPHFAVHTSREYKPRLGDRRWHLRFDRAGRLRSCKEKSYSRPGRPGN